MESSRTPKYKLKNLNNLDTKTKINIISGSMHIDG